MLRSLCHGVFVSKAILYAIFPRFPNLASFVIALPLDSSSPPENKSTTEELGVSKKESSDAERLASLDEARASLIVKDELNLVTERNQVGL